MSSSVPSHATPIMLKWAREKSGYTIKDVADAENVSEELIKKWESGDEMPTIAKLRRLAKRYKYPLMIFYLPKPQHQFSMVKDFRLTKNASKRAFSPKLCFGIRRAQELQAWAAGLLESEEVETVDFVESISEQDDVSRVANDLRMRLNVTISMQLQCETDHEALKLWRENIEELGCFVFQISGVEVKEMRGFALPNEYAPAVVVNAREFPTPRIFTMVHELVHVLLGQTVITGESELYYSKTTRVAKTERFCNQVAAATIVPESDFRAKIPSDWKQRDDEIIRELATVYRVSRATVALRLFELGYAKKQWLSSKMRLYNTNRPSKRHSQGGPTREVLALSQNGRMFSTLAVSAFHAGTIHGGELTSLLNLKLKHLGKFESLLYPSRVRSLVESS